MRNQVTLWFKRDNTTFFLAKIATRFQFGSDSDTVFVNTHTSEVKVWNTPLGHTMKCEKETRLGDSITGMFCIDKLQVAAFIPNNCGLPEEGE